MRPFKSLDEIEIIAAALHDVNTMHGLVFNTKALRQTTQVVRRRCLTEGIGFLTKTCPRLGKAFDKALASVTPLNATALGFKSQVGSELPRFLGEFFNRVLKPDGTLLQCPCTVSVEVIRQLLFLFYKYELPYSDEQEQQVVSAFKKTESDLTSQEVELQMLGHFSDTYCYSGPKSSKDLRPSEIIREARQLLARVFARFDPLDIHPRHGPGVVATKQKLQEKYLWTNVSQTITDLYPYDAYFCASAGHVCDTYQSFSKIGSTSFPARVVLVPKDSRGPRLISCEPVDYQWIQQGLGRAIVELVENHPLTKFSVFFTDQTPNRCAAIHGSRNGRYATLDLKEASDRVSLGLVRLLFPKHVYTYLEACRTTSTVLPSGEELKLKKFAPMGSCLCFPVLALTTWAILAAGRTDTPERRESLHVYGDDVIVPTAYAANAIERLESFGLKVNRDKSCTSGLFRESCGMDAFKGVCVTPVRLRTVWSSAPRSDSFSSWIAYANLFYKKKYFYVYDYIVEHLFHTYGPIPAIDMHLACPSLIEVPDAMRPKVKRFNKSLQKLEWKVLDIKSPTIVREIDGWSMLLRFFAESGNTRRPIDPLLAVHEGPLYPIEDSVDPFSVRLYTSPRTSKLVRRWR